jgi:hypothetical protein
MVSAEGSERSRSLTAERSELMVMLQGCVVAVVEGAAAVLATASPWRCCRGCRRQDCRHCLHAVAPVDQQLSCGV